MVSLHPSVWLIVCAAATAVGFAAETISGTTKTATFASVGSSVLMAQSLPPSDPGTWVEIVDKLGFPVAMIFVFIGFGWFCFRWLTKDVAPPIIAAHVEYLKKTQAAQERQAETLQCLETAQDKLCENQQRLTATQEKMLGLLENHFERRSMERREGSS